MQRFSVWAAVLALCCSCENKQQKTPATTSPAAPTAPKSVKVKTPARVLALLPLPTPPARPVVSLGRNHACSLRGGLVYCRGDNMYSQVTNDAGKKGVEQRVPNVSGALSVVAGGNHTCAIVARGDVYCWGLGQLGQTGNRTRAPARVANLTNVAQLALGNEHTCALLRDRTVVCWGRNGEGQLGLGTIPGPGKVVFGKDDAAAYGALRNKFGEAKAKPVVGLKSVEQIALGYRHSCALIAGGEVRCWGNNTRGQIGFISKAKRARLATPRKVAGLPPATQISARSNQTCALLRDKTVRCWGSDELATRGEDRVPPGPEKVAGLRGVVRVVVGAPQACAVLSDRSVRCWGGMYLGDGKYHASGSPAVKVATSARVADLSLGFACACAMLTSGKTVCWGYNNYRQLDGSKKRTLSTPRPY